MKKIIVFGLGRICKKYKTKLEEKYEIIAYTSNDESERQSDVCKGGQYISLSEINEYPFDYIVICCEADIEVFNQLTEDFDIDGDKILLWRELFSSGSIFQWEGESEDILINLLLSLIGIRSDFYYLELGSFHPIKGSNTYSLYKLGGHGVLVDANKNLKKITERVRPRDVFINKAITKDGRETMFYQLEQWGLSTISYDSIDKDMADSITNFAIQQKYNVDGISMNEIIHLIERTPDVLSIDVEGSVWDVLQQIKFESFRPSIIVCETAPWGYKKHSRDEFNIFFKQAGYVLFHENIGNGIFIEQKYLDKIKKYML